MTPNPSEFKKSLREYEKNFAGVYYDSLLEKMAIWAYLYALERAERKLIGDYLPRSDEGVWLVREIGKVLHELRKEVEET